MVQLFGSKNKKKDTSDDATRRENRNTFFFSETAHTFLEAA